MEAWHVNAAVNLLILAAYIVISFSIARPLLKSRQSPRENPLAWATSAIFFTCAIHHGGHPAHQLLPYIGLEEHVGLHMREALNEWHLTVWDVVGAGVALWYLSLRARFPALVRGAAMFEDMKVRQRQALEIHDNVVQGLASAKISLELGREAEGLAAVEATLEASRKIITDLLGEEGSEIEFQPGDFRRTSTFAVTGSGGGG